MSQENEFEKLEQVMREIYSAYQAEIEKDFTELMDNKHGKATGKYPQTERFSSLYEIYKAGRQQRNLKGAMSSFEQMFAHGYGRHMLIKICEDVGLSVDFQEDGYRGPDPKIQEAITTAVIAILQDLRKLGH